MLVQWGQNTLRRQYFGETGEIESQGSETQGSDWDRLPSQSHQSNPRNVRRCMFCLNWVTQRSSPWCGVTRTALYSNIEKIENFLKFDFHASMNSKYH